MLFLAPLGYHTQTMIEYSLVKLMSSVNQNQDMMYVKKSITIGNVTVWHVFYCMFVLCIQHTVKSYVCIYVHMPIDSVFTYYLVLIRWPWRKGLSNSLSLSSPKLYCLASGLQNTILGRCFFEVATVCFSHLQFQEKNLWISSCCID